MKVQASTEKDYEACLEYFYAKEYWGTYYALKGDGFDPNVDYRKLMEDK